MALKIPIQAIPNQSLNVLLNQQNCTINLKTYGTYMYFDLYLNNSAIILGRKITLTPMIIYDYLKQKFNGNFILLNDDLNQYTIPFYTNFGISQSLFYYTEDEII